MMAVCVDPKRINEVWPHVSHFIKDAYASGIGDETFEIIEAEILKGEALLWLAGDDQIIFAAAATRISIFPTKKVCSVLAVSGQEMDEWATECLLGIEAYAKEEKCDVVRLCGRQGWKRMFKDYSEPWIILEKRL